MFHGIIPKVNLKGDIMNILDIFLIGVGLSMDAFAVSICKGLSVKKLKFKNLLICGIYFGVFQALMPVIGYFLGSAFASMVDSIDHWIAFILLAIIGGNMIKEAFESEEANDDFSFPTMFMLAVATSIDALAVGVTFSFMKVHIVSAVMIIGVTTFVLSMIGVWIGHQFGARYRAKAQIAGGIILIIIGLRILITDLIGK